MTDLPYTPWQAEKLPDMLHEDRPWRWCVRGERRYETGGYDNIWIAEVGSPLLTQDENETIARTIASLPELLKACRELIAAHQIGEKK